MVTTDAEGHIPRSWFRTHVWVPARAAAGLGAGVRVQDLRHAHASWLLAGGADIETVKERLGHASILTTQKYLHSLPEADDAAVDAFTRIRRPKRMTVERGTNACSFGTKRPWVQIPPPRPNVGLDLHKR
jgi:integrase